MAEGPLIGAYARWRSSTLGRITDELQQRLLLEMVGDVQGLRVLDIGCGDGVLATALARCGGQVTGIDSDRRMLEAAQLRASRDCLSIRLEHGQADALPFPDGTFDRVIAVTVLCFVPDASRAINEMVRVLKPDGRLVIGELGRWNVWAARRRIQAWMGNRVWRAAQFRSAADLRRLVQSHGLVVRSTRGSTYYPPWGRAASWFAALDPWLGRRTTFGAALIVLDAEKPT